MASFSSSSLSDYRSPSPKSYIIQNTGVFRFAPIHETNTAGLSILLDSVPPNLQQYQAPEPEIYGESPPRYLNCPTPQPHPSPPRPTWSPVTSFHTPQRPAFSPLTPPPRRSSPRLPAGFVPEPVDMDALLQHNPFRLAEEYGGNQITDRSTLFWIEACRLPSPREIGLDRYLHLYIVRKSDAEMVQLLHPSIGRTSEDERMLRLI